MRSPAKILKLLSRFVLAVVVCAGLLMHTPVAKADGSVTIDLSSVSSGGSGYTFGGGVVTITTAGNYTITGYNGNTLAVADNVAGTVNLTLNGVYNQIYNINRSPFVIGANDDVNMILSGSNTLSAYSASSYTSVAGITVPSTASLTITGDGSLVAYGSGTGAGIGTTDLGGGSGGAITIESGSVTATGGYNSGGNSNSGINGTIVINGGTVTATGGQAYGGGGGSGLGGNVTINGGTVDAKAGSGNNGSAGIGGSCGQSGGTITINGGDVTATGQTSTAESGAGIGGGRLGAGGNITINGGHVTAIAGGKSAGIGGGYAGLGGNITITNQNGDTYVSATGDGGAGIGCGYTISSNNTTSITITGGTVIADGSGGQGGAGIGGSYFCGDNTNQTIKISGGDVTATGGQKSAGIGGAYNGGGGTILISGGKVTATGGDQGSGIGCGYNWQAATNGGTITITGGTVQANGGSNGAGIGGGQNAAGGTITISGEADTTVVNATGGNYGAGIGSGEDQSQTANNGNGGTIKIDGGTVTAIGGNEAAGIGGGRDSNAGTITINGGLVTASASLDAAGIGSGRNSTYSQQGANFVTINGGRVYATGSNTADIGGSYPGLGGGLNNNSYAATNIFNGGSIRAGIVNAAPVLNSTNLYKIVLTATNIDESVLADTEVTYKVNGSETGIPAATDELGNLYLWLPVTPDGDVTTIEVDKGDTEYLATGQVTADNAAVITAHEQTYKISPIADQVCADLTEGYSDGSQDIQTITITNTGTGTLNNLSVALGTGEDAYFDITAPSAAQLASGVSVDFTVKAKVGLSAGDYSATVTIRADKMDDAVFHVSQSVKLIDVKFFIGKNLYDSRSVHYQTAIGQADWPTSPQMDGYEFIGWYIDEDTQLLPETAVTGKLMVAAGWRAIDYDIDYNLNDGAADPANPASYNVEYEDITLINPEKTGYTFAGWTGTDVVTPTMSVTIPAGSMGNRSYTANWTANTYTVSYNANGGTGTTAASEHTYGVQKALTTNGFTRAGYTFAGWATAATGSAAYSDGQSVKNLTEASNATVQLFAVWTRIDYTITYALNGGSVSPSNPTGYTAETAEFTLHNPVKTGYTFAGWSGSGINGVATSVIIPKGSVGNKAYTANWTAISYSISYTLNGGTVSTANPTAYTIASAAITLTNPTRTGYTFTGWSGTGITGVSTSVIIPKGSVGDRTYTANWTAVSYSISYALNGGTVSPANPTAYTIASAAITLTNPTRTGYTFTGWSGTGITGVSTSVIIPKGSVGSRAYTANWLLRTYTITAAPNNTAWGSVAGTGKYNEGASCSLTAVPKSGCRFVNWTQGGTAVSVNPVYGFTVSADRTLVANFAVIGTPSLNAPVSAGYNSIKLTWPAVTGAKGYYVYRAAAINGAYSKINTVTGLSYTDTGLSCGTTYYYKIQAYCVAGSTTTVSPFSGIKSAAPVLPVPLNVKAAKASSTSAKVSWSAAAGAAGYEISRAASLKGTYSTLGTTSALYFTSTRLTAGATYYFKVRAYCMVGQAKVYSGYSVIVSCTLQ